MAGIINQIKPFCTEGSVGDYDVLPLEQYAPAAPLGNRAGIASRALVNTVLRQVSFVAAGVAELIATYRKDGVLDNGDLTQITEGFKEVFKAFLPDATQDVKGIAAIATYDEVVAGTNNTKFVTPLSAQALKGSGGGGGANVVTGESSQGIFYTITTANDNTEILHLHGMIETEAVSANIVLPTNIYTETLGVSMAVEGVAGSTSSNFICVMTDLQRDNFNVQFTSPSGGTKKLFISAIAKVDRREFPDMPVNVTSKAVGNSVTFNWS